MHRPYAKASPPWLSKGNAGMRVGQDTEPPNGKKLVSSPTSSGCRPQPSARSTKAAGKSNFFFKWINRHLSIKRFFGTTENAVKTQIWIAVSV
jgi:hypothetical protein